MDSQASELTLVTDGEYGERWARQTGRHPLTVTKQFGWYNGVPDHEPTPSHVPDIVYERLRGGYSDDDYARFYESAEQAYADLGRAVRWFHEVVAPLHQQGGDTSPLLDVMRRLIESGQAPGYPPSACSEWDRAVADAEKLLSESGDDEGGARAVR